MLKKYIDIMICILLVFVIFLEIIFLSIFAPFLYKKSYTNEEWLRKTMLDGISKEEKVFFKKSIFFKPFSKSTSKDSIVYYYNTMDSLYKVKK